MIRIKLSFIKTKVDPLVQHYRSDLHQFCHERAHAFDYLRELLNIYFQKPTNKMGFGNLNVTPDSLAFLESLRQEFEELYHAPQGTRRTKNNQPEIISTSNDINLYNTQSPAHSRMGDTVPSTPVTDPNTQPLSIHTINPPTPPKPVWNNITGIWEIPEPEPIQQMIPPEPIWNDISKQWELPIEQPIRETPEGYISPQPTYPSEEEIAAIIGEEKEEE